MAALLPRSEPVAASASSRFLVLCGVLAVVPGMIHVFLPDGGAGVIAGIDLSRDAARTVSMFAWAGATQIAHGIVTLLVALRYRALVPLFLLVSLIERLLLSWSGWIKHVPVSGHHPPEHYASLISLPIILLFLWLSMRRSGQTQPESPE